jgi:hypothetical protein
MYWNRNQAKTLHDCAYEGDVEGVRRLLDLGNNVDDLVREVLSF